MTEKGKNYVIIILAAIVALYTYFYFSVDDKTDDFIPRSKDLSDSLKTELAKSDSVRLKQYSVIDSLNLELNKADSILRKTSKQYYYVKEKIMASEDSVVYNIIITHIDSAGSN